MKIALISRYPRVDTARWKLQLAQDLRDAGHTLSVHYTRAAFIDQAVANNVTLQPNNPLDFREDLVRLDYHLSDKHSIYFTPFRARKPLCFSRGESSRRWQIAPVEDHQPCYAA